MLNSLRRLVFFGPLVKALTLLGLILFIDCFLRLWYYGWSYNPGFLDFTANVATLVAIIPLLGLQTEWGRHVIGELIQIIPLNRWWRQSPEGVCLVLWLLVALMYGGLDRGYPYLARKANIDGAQALRDGDYSVALDEFRWAVSLSPEDAQAHYNLGNTYQALHDNESAISAYRLALAEDDKLWPAYNNLGQLYLSALDDPDAALLILHAGLTKVKVNDPPWKAVLRKNIGWAYLEKGQPHAALSELQAATEKLECLNDDKKANFWIYLTETYRLTALTYETLAQENPERAEADRWQQEAQQAWIESEAYAQAILTSSLCQSEDTLASFECLNARLWASEARERLE